MKKFFLCLALLVAPICAYGEGAGEAEKIKAAVYIEGKELKEAFPWQVSHIVAQSLEETGMISAITEEEIKTLLGIEQTRQLIGCDSADCYTNITKSLEAKIMVAGELKRTTENKAFALSLKLIDLSKGEVINRLSRSLTGDAADIKSGCENSARILVRPLLKLAPGELSLVVSEAEAKVSVNGKLVGLAPIPRLTLDGGVHSLRVELEGFNPWEKDLKIAPNSSVAERIDLVPSQNFITAYKERANAVMISGIVLTAAGAALAATGLALYFSEQKKAKDIEQDIIQFNSGARTDAQKRAQLEEDRESIKKRGIIWSTMGIAGVPVFGSGLLMWILSPDPNKYQSFEKKN